MDQAIRPKEMPNSVGLRHDTGPHHEPPSIRAITPCTTPEAIISVPAHHSTRWYAPTGRAARHTIPTMSVPFSKPG
jgi:hypothetical protein